MRPLIRDAIAIPADRPCEVLGERIEAKRALLDERDRTLGSDRIRIQSYMENIEWPELFGYDMNRFLSEPEFRAETELRQRIFWLDNVDDDGLPGFDAAATVGMYYDIALFGQQVRHSTIGVPEFLPHPISQSPDLSLIPIVDFRTSGRMPDLIRQHQELDRLAETRYGGRLSIGFPEFRRGPLDVCVQLRGYDRFVEDTLDRPEFVHGFLDLVVRERVQWNRERRRYLGLSEPEDPTTTVDDDWVNIPFISPAIFTEFVVPAYRQIAAAEGRVVGFHTCGVMVPVVRQLLEVFPDIRTLDVSGWNDFEMLDEMLDPEVGFWLSFKNTFVLAGTAAGQRDVLERIVRVGERRSVGVCAQAIVRLHDTYEEDFARLNAFISLARDVFGQAA